MTTGELMKHLNMPSSKFYKLQDSGIIPKPCTGGTKRKWYSSAELKTIYTNLKKVGEWNKK